MLKVMRAEINKYIHEMMNYYPDYIGNIFLTLFFFFLFFSKINFDLNSEEGITLVVGFIFWFFLSNSISQMSISISQEKQVGTFEQLLLRPVSIEKILLIRTICWNLISLLIIAIIYCIFFIFFKINITLNINLLLLVYVYIMSLISFIGIAYFLASFTIIYTKTASFTSIIEYFLLFISGIIVPVDSFNNLFKYLSKITPLSYTVDIITQIILKKKINLNHVINFSILCMTYFFLGILFFKYFKKKSFIHGLNSKY